MIQRKFPYKFTIDVAVDSAAKRISDVSADLAGIDKFIADAESDTRGRLILENNTSGLPALLIVTGNGPTVRYDIHHPLHDIGYSPSDKSWNYAYAGELKLFERLPEVKRAQSEKTVSEFIASAVPPVRVAVSGNPKTFFHCSFLTSGGKRLKVRVEGKNVTTLSE
jgi:hypothetical protein